MPARSWRATPAPMCRLGPTGPTLQLLTLLYRRAQPDAAVTVVLSAPPALTVGELWSRNATHWTRARWPSAAGCRSQGWAESERRAVCWVAFGDHLHMEMVRNCDADLGEERFGLHVAMRRRRELMTVPSATSSPAWLQTGRVGTRVLIRRPCRIIVSLRNQHHSASRAADGFGSKFETPRVQPPLRQPRSRRRGRPTKGVRRSSHQRHASASEGGCGTLITAEGVRTSRWWPLLPRGRRRRTRAATSPGSRRGYGSTGPPTPLTGRPRSLVPDRTPDAPALLRPRPAPASQAPGAAL